MVITMHALLIVLTDALMAIALLPKCTAPCSPKHTYNRLVLVIDQSCAQMDRVPLLAVNARYSILAECWDLRLKFVVRMERAIWPIVVALFLLVQLAGLFVTLPRRLMEDVCLI